MFKIFMISILRWSEVMTMMIKCANVPFRVAQSMNTRVPLSITFPCNSHDKYKIQIQKNLINNINASQQWWKLTNTNVSMGFWAKTRVEWSGYPFDCYDDCGSKTPFFNSTKANSKAIWAMPIWKQHIWRRGFPEYKSTCGANKFDKYKDKYIQDIKHKQEGQLCI